MPRYTALPFTMALTLAAWAPSSVAWAQQDIRVLITLPAEPAAARASAVNAMLGELVKLGFRSDNRAAFQTCEASPRDVISGTFSEEEIKVARSALRSGARIYHNPIVSPNYVNPCPGKPHDMGETKLKEAVGLNEKGLAQGKDVVVAIVDRGIDMTPINRSFRAVTINDTYSWPKRPTPIVGKHGTLCAYVAAMAAPAVELADVRVTGDTRSFSEAYKHLYETWKKNTTKKALVVSTSWSFRARPAPKVFDAANETLASADHPLRLSVQCLLDAGVDVVFPAGNSGKCERAIESQSGTITPPNSMQAVLTMAAVDSRKVRLGDSGQGGMQAPGKPDISAFGSLILNRMEAGRHTSVATALAAGMVASLRSLEGWSTKQRPFALVRNCFVQHADKSVALDEGATTIVQRLTRHSLDFGNGIMRFNSQVLQWKDGCGKDPATTAASP